MTNPLSEAGTGVEVKPLEWESFSPSIQVARSAIGEYRITYHMAIEYHAHFDGKPVGDGPWRTDAPAKAACLADYEQRIRRALIQPTPAETEGEVTDVMVERAAIQMYRYGLDDGGSPSLMRSAARAAIQAAMAARYPTPPNIYNLADEAVAAIEALRAERDALALKDKRWHEDFWDVENERRAICLELKHAMNSSTPVSAKVKELVAQVSTLSRQLEEAREALVIVRRCVKNARGAIESDQVVDKDVHGSLSWVLRTIDDAMRAKETVSK